MNALLETNFRFSSYSQEHLLIVIFFTVMAVLLHVNTRKKSHTIQSNILFGISWFIASLQLLKIPVKLYLGTYDVNIDLPLHLCNFLPFLFVIMYSTKSRNLWGVIFIWTILGTFQAVLTPAVDESLFYFDAIRYWVVHCGLVLIALYPAFMWKWTLKAQDVWKSLLWLNVAALLLYAINSSIGTSNYLYVMHRPPGQNLFRMFPPWPYYLLVIEVLLVVWGYMLLFLFWLSAKRRRHSN